MNSTRQGLLCSKIHPCLVTSSCQTHLFVQITQAVPRLTQTLDLLPKHRGLTKTPTPRSPRRFVFTAIRKCGLSTEVTPGTMNRQAWFFPPIIQLHFGVLTTRLLYSKILKKKSSHTGIIFCMRPANERRRYIVTSSLIGWAHTQNDHCPYLACKVQVYGAFVNFDVLSQSLLHTMS